MPDAGEVPLVARHVVATSCGSKFDVSQVRADLRRRAEEHRAERASSSCSSRKDLVDGGRKDIPKIFRYATHAENNSLYNTPPTFAIYLVRNVLAWVKEIGRPRRDREAATARRASVLYGAIDAHADFYRAPVEKTAARSMNVVFRLPTEELEEKFVAEAAEAEDGRPGRAPLGRRHPRLDVQRRDGRVVEALVAFMNDFAKRSPA